MHYGIDVGGTKTEFAVFDSKFNRQHSHRIKTPTGNYNEFLDAIRSLVSDGDREYDDNCSIGIGITGIVNAEGQSFSTNVPCLNGHQVRSDLIAAIGREVRCINDVRAFALSEAQGGAAEGFRTMVGIILGTGAASGYCREGKPRIGMDGVAGDWGHLSVPATFIRRHGLPLFECTCGKAGCIEMYVSGQGLGRLAGYTLGDSVSSKAVVARMRNGDQRATEVFDVWVDCFGHVVAQQVLQNNPDVIVVGGGMSNIEELYDKVPAAADRYLYDDLHAPPIRRAMFGDDSGVRGAAIIGAT